MKIKKIKYTYTCEDNFYVTESIDSTKIDEIICELCRHICFSDLCDFQLNSIKITNESGYDIPLDYVGWQSNHLFEFVDLDGKVVISYQGPNSWDH